jgi:type I restriction enzyme M protein
MRITQQQLEAHLWGAANILRGKTAGQDYKNYILSLMFYKRPLTVAHSADQG